MNELFLNRMTALLGPQMPAYLDTLEQPAYRGLRANLLKISPDVLAQRGFIELEPSPFAPEGFRIPSDARLGHHIYHRQGLFYLQEPSASSAVTVLNPEPGDWVLDLCAAPGGKSTQIAARLHHRGYLVSNEIDASRARVLMSNFERLGVSEAMITNASPEQLCPELQGWMDKVLVDAPCSGEGMFKKEDQALQDWSVEHVSACAHRQLKILDSAAVTLKQNGILVYSTCTYSSEENEQVIAGFLQAHPEFELLDCGVQFGRLGIKTEGIDASKVRRIFPMDGGEGHFIAKLRKTSAEHQAKRHLTKSQPLPACVQAFIKDQLDAEKLWNITVSRDQFWLQRQPFFTLNGIRVLRSGIMAGEIVKNRVEPHHHFYTSADITAHLCRRIELDEMQLQAYLRGEPLAIAAEKGYLCLCYQSYPVGFGKSDGQLIKNKYPKGLRARE